MSLMNQFLLIISICFILINAQQHDNKENMETEVINEQPRPHSFHFTTDYFSIHHLMWKALFEEVFPVGLEYNFLEVGSWEGRSTVWLLQNVLTHPDSKLSCVDTWLGGADYYTPDQIDGLFDRFLHNIQPWRYKVDVYKGYSSDALKTQEIVSQKFTFIYIDAGHHSKNVLEDAVLAFPLLDVGGIMVFDDYLGGPDATVHNIEFPKAGVDAFLKIYAGRYNLLKRYTDYQMVIQKKSD